MLEMYFDGTICIHPSATAKDISCTFLFKSTSIVNNVGVAGGWSKAHTHTKEGHTLSIQLLTVSSIPYYVCMYLAAK